MFADLPTIRLAGRADQIYQAVMAGNPVRPRDARVLARHVDELATQLEAFAGLPAVARPTHYDRWYAQSVMYIAEVVANLQRLEGQR